MLRGQIVCAALGSLIKKASFSHLTQTTRRDIAHEAVEFADETLLQMGIYVVAEIKQELGPDPLQGVGGPE